jgi:hypothetical protein
VVIGAIKMESRLSIFPNKQKIDIKQADNRINDLMSRPNRSEASDNELDELSDAIDTIDAGKRNSIKVKREAGNTDPRGWYMVEKVEGKKKEEATKEMVAVSSLKRGGNKTPEELGLKKVDKTYWTQSGKTIKLPEETYEIKGHKSFVANKWVNRHGEVNYVWRSVEAVSSEDGIRLIETLAEKHKGASFHINTGGHGGIGEGNNPTQEGSGGVDNGDVRFTEKERGMVNKYLKEDQVSFLHVSPYTEPIAPTNANHIVLLWCYSGSNTSRLKGTEEPENSGRGQSPISRRRMYDIPKGVVSDYEAEIKKLMGGRFMGVEAWLKLGKKVSDAPEITLEMVKYLKLECEVIRNGKKVNETHQLVLIPKGVSVEDMHRLCVGKKSDSKIDDFIDKFEGKHAGKAGGWTTKGMEASYWSLMYVGDRSVDNGVIPGSRDKDWDDQVKVFNEMNARIGGVYEIIRGREAILSTLMRYMSTGEKILTYNESSQPNTGTRTLDHWDKNGWGSGRRVFVGEFDGDGLNVDRRSDDRYSDPYRGLGMVRKYR